LFIVYNSGGKGLLMNTKSPDMKTVNINRVPELVELEVDSAITCGVDNRDEAIRIATFCAKVLKSMDESRGKSLR